MKTVVLVAFPLLVASATAKAATISGTLINEKTLQLASGHGGSPVWIDLEEDLGAGSVIPPLLRTLRGARVELTGEWDAPDVDGSPLTFRVTSVVMGVHGTLALARGGTEGPDLLSWESSLDSGAIELDLRGKPDRTGLPLAGKAWVFGRLVRHDSTMPTFYVTDIRMDAGGPRQAIEGTGPGAELVAAIHTLYRALVPLPGGGWGLQVGSEVYRLDDTTGGGADDSSDARGAGQAR